MAKGILEVSTSQALVPETKCRINVTLLRGAASLEQASLTLFTSSPCQNDTYSIISHKGPGREPGSKILIIVITETEILFLLPDFSWLYIAIVLHLKCKNGKLL